MYIIIIGIYDLILDTILGAAYCIRRGPFWTLKAIGAVMFKSGKWLTYTMPNNVSLLYHIQKIFYPYKYPEFTTGKDSYLFDKEKNAEDFIAKHDIEWLNENIGKFRWKIIGRKHYKYDTLASYDKRKIFITYHLCFRHNQDAAGFKLWREG